MASSGDDLKKEVSNVQYEDVLTSADAQDAIREFVASLLQKSVVTTPSGDRSRGASHGKELGHSRLTVGLAAFNAFLQTNVTGPVLREQDRIEAAFLAAAHLADGSGSSLAVVRRECFKSLDVDGVSPYPYIPSIELFCLARYVLTRYPDSSPVAPCADGAGKTVTAPGGPPLRWLRLRVHVWHYKLLTQPSFGGSLFNKSALWSDVPSLEQTIQTELDALEQEVMGHPTGLGKWTSEERGCFLVEKANICIMLGQDKKARTALKEASEVSGFKYALSGALGKRTRFQEKSTSQLVVLAKSAGASTTDGPGANGEPQAVPQALPLNDDTLLEDLKFTGSEGKEELPSGLPAELKDLLPDEQPQLRPIDQIVLLAEATIMDAFSPTDSLTSEEILPFATRVLSDKSTNWQIYSQALLVRSRIEVHRSRTVERGVLQMQAVVDQVIVDTTTASPSDEEQVLSQKGEKSQHVGPVIEISDPDGKTTTGTTRQLDKPASFFPAAKPVELAPAHVRLEYIHALSSPPRWHLESELAYSWAGVGSLVSALEIFKRLRMWAEVALCFASSAATDDEGGRGSGGEEKAMAILRWRLFHRTGTAAGSSEPDDELEGRVEELRSADYHGPERNPPPPNAPRLFCILGDIENQPEHYETAWQISGKRFARAQKSLGEHYLQQRCWSRAKEAYEKAIKVNHLNPELWNRLGDISLCLGELPRAAEAFQRAIASAGDLVGGEDARTWSNLGSTLYSLYVERVKEEVKKERDAQKYEVEQAEAAQEEDDEEPTETKLLEKRDPSHLLSQALAAYKRGAAIANNNWRIWDNVITLAARMRPPPISDIVFALRHVIRIRDSEDALDIDVLRLLLNEAVLSKQKPEITDAISSLYEPPRGSSERAVCDLLETAIVPLITKRSDLWELVARERVWRRDYAGAVDAAERAWRAAVGGAGTGLAASAASAAGDGDAKSRNWLEDKEAWQNVVDRTEELVSALENYGPDIPEIGTRWKSKARSAARSVMGKAKETWEGSNEWERLQGLLDVL